MLHLARANAKGECPQPTMAGGVAIPTDNGCTGKRKSLFWPDHMDDALLQIRRADIANAKGRGVALQRGQLSGTFRVCNRQTLARRIQPRRCRQIMIRHRQCQIRTPHFAARQAQTFKRLRAGDFMDEMPVDEDKAGAILTAIDDMGVPDFFVQSAWACRHDHSH